jgi:hypothetical protein
MSLSPYAGAPLGYFDSGSTPPNGIVELMPGARNLVEYLGVAAGDRVLILTEHGVDHVVIQATAAAAAYLGAEVHILSVPAYSAGGWDREAPSPLVPAIYPEADVVISFAWWPEVHSEPLFFGVVFQNKARMVSVSQTATAAAFITAARFPAELYYAICRKAKERLASCNELRITTERGTDVTITDLGRIDADEGPLPPHGWRPWPFGGVNFNPVDANGILVIEESTVTGYTDEPVRVELKGNVVMSIEGRENARRLRAFSISGYYVRHAVLGLNPKARVARAAQFEREKHAGIFYLGLDGLVDGKQDRMRPGFAHCDCLFVSPSVFTDGTPLVESGRLLLLDDPEVREVASRFGPPELLLDAGPTIVLPPKFMTAGHAG